MLSGRLIALSQQCRGMRGRPQSSGRFGHPLRFLPDELEDVGIVLFKGRNRGSQAS